MSPGPAIGCSSEGCYFEAMYRLVDRENDIQRRVCPDCCDALRSRFDTVQVYRLGGR